MGYGARLKISATEMIYDAMTRTVAIKDYQDRVAQTKSGMICYHENSACLRGPNIHMLYCYN